MAKVPVTLSVSQLIKVLEGFIGVKLSHPTILKWLGSGYFPNARKQAALANSRWVIPVNDVIAYVQSTYPGGPITDDVDDDVKTVYQHIVSLAYPSNS